MVLIIRSNQQPPLLHGSSSQICLLHSPIMKGSPFSAAFQQTCKECNANMARGVDLIRFCLDIPYSVSRREGGGGERERERERERENRAGWHYASGSANLAVAPENRGRDLCGSSRKSAAHAEFVLFSPSPERGDTGTMRGRDRQACRSPVPSKERPWQRENGRRNLCASHVAGAELRWIRTRSLPRR